jgi:hypothetical membrane protein
MSIATHGSARAQPFGLLAAAGPILFLAAWCVSGLTQDGYRLERDDESALAAAGAAHPWLTMVGDSLLGLGFIAFAVVVGAALRGRRAAIGCGLLIVSGIATIVQALVREDCVSELGLCKAAGRPDTWTWHQTVHDSASRVAFLAILASAFVLARPIRVAGHRELARYSRLTGGIGLVFLVAFIIVSDSSVGGIAEFIFLLVPLAWVAITASSLVVSHPHQAGRPGAVRQ